MIASHVEDWRNIFSLSSVHHKNTSIKIFIYAALYSRAFIICLNLDKYYTVKIYRELIYHKVIITTGSSTRQVSISSTVALSESKPRN